MTAGKILRIAVLLAAVAFTAWFAYAIVRILLLIFAGTLIAVFFYGCADWLKRRIKIPYGLGVTLILLLLLGLAALSGWFVAPHVQQQWQDFRAQIPNALEHLQNLQNDGNNQIVQSLIGAAGTFASNLSPVKHISEWAVDMIVIMFLSLYLAYQPELYREGLLSLFPLDRRAEARAGLDQLGNTMWRWFIGRIIGMIAIGLLVYIGLSIIGFPLAFTLAILAFVFEFVPYAGAIVSSIPAILIALTRGFESVWVVMLMYLLVHGIDGYIIVPLVERRAVRIPPGLTIVVQLALYVTAGVLGVLIADPLTACVMVLVKRYFLKRQLEAR